VKKKDDAQAADAGQQPPTISTGGDAEATRSTLAGVAATIADAAGPVISAALRPVDNLATEARRLLGERSGARVRRIRKMGRQPLANLWELHPEVHRASIRDLGVMTVPVEEIRGTAVEGPIQRGGDFLPLRDRRGDDWRARWQRILGAVENLTNLPPIELIKFGDDYWVTDGHNRVAAALYTGQISLDADVTEYRLPGMAATRPRNLAGVLEGSADLRAAGSGRLTGTTLREPDVPKPSHEHRHGTDERGK
jgi:hypothetical protein